MGSVEKQGIRNAWPVGFGFRPREDELINHYLTGKLSGLNKDDLVIPELNIYHWEPQTLFEMYNGMSDYPSDGGEWFFYCTMDGKNRKTPRGFWKETTKKHTFWSCDGEEKGYKRIFVYYEGRQPYGRKSLFSMHEYHLNCCTNPKIKADQGPSKEFVLCRIINRKIMKIKPVSPSECLEPDLVTTDCTATNQGDKNNEASPQVCDPQHNLTETGAEAEAEAGGRGGCSEMKLLQYDESICSEPDQFTYIDQIDDPVDYIDYGPVDGVFISELWG